MSQKVLSGDDRLDHSAIAEPAGDQAISPSTWTPFFEKWVRRQTACIAGRLRTRNEPVEPVDARERVKDRRESAGIECINCAVCYAACDTVVQGNPAYLGPAALATVPGLCRTTSSDEREGRPFWTPSSATGGCQSCHAQQGPAPTYLPERPEPHVASISGPEARWRKILLPAARARRLAMEFRLYLLQRLTALHHGPSRASATSAGHDLRDPGRPHRSRNPRPHPGQPFFWGAVLRRCSSLAVAIHAAIGLRVTLPKSG